MFPAITEEQVVTRNPKSLTIGILLNRLTCNDIDVMPVDVERISQRILKGYV